MDNNTPPHAPIPRDRALVAGDPDASSEAIAERARAWLRDVARTARHTRHAPYDHARRLPVFLDEEPTSTIIDAPSYVDEGRLPDTRVARGPWRPRAPERVADVSEIVAVDPDGAARSGPQSVPVEDGEGVR